MVVSITRLLNQGLLLISPIILARLLSVEDFGRYREFLLYVTVLNSFAAFGVNSSLLRFIPDRPDLSWRFVNQAVLITLASSALVVGLTVGLNAALGAKLVGDYQWPVALYVLLFVNLDFWEFLWLAQKRTLAVFGYTTGRLIARMVVVISAAALTSNVNVIIWSLVALEAVRVFASLLAWQSSKRHESADASGSWREQLRYCLPFGASLMMITLNKSMGNLFVAKLLGPVALAHYSIGTYLKPVTTVLRNSLSDVLLPEMVAQNRDGQTDRLLLWRRMTVVTAMFLVASGFVLGRFAEILVVTVFSEEYRPAVAIFQLYLLVLLRESIDFGVPVRAINSTTPILHSNILALIVNALLLAVLMPLAGLLGAVAALVLSRTVEGIYLGAQTLRIYRAPLRQLASWNDLAKVVIAGAAASVTLYWAFWTDVLGFAGVVIGSIVYLLVYSILLHLMGVPEMGLLLRRIRAFPRSFPATTK